MIRVRAAPSAWLCRRAPSAPAGYGARELRRAAPVAAARGCAAQITGATTGPPFSENLGKIARS
jgi:hypothetical protein